MTAIVTDKLLEESDAQLAVAVVTRFRSFVACQGWTIVGEIRIGTRIGEERGASSRAVLLGARTEQLYRRRKRAGSKKTERRVRVKDATLRDGNLEGKRGKSWAVDGWRVLFGLRSGWTKVRIRKVQIPVHLHSRRAGAAGCRCQSACSLPGARVGQVVPVTWDPSVLLARSERLELRDKFGA